MFVLKTSSNRSKEYIFFQKVWLFIEFNFAISDLPDCDGLLRHLYYVTMFPIIDRRAELTGYKTTGERKKERERVEIPGNDRRDGSIVNPTSL